MIELFLLGGALVALYYSHENKRPESVQKKNELYGSLHENLNFNNIITYLKPAFEPSKFLANKTSQKRVEARLESYSPNPIVNKMGSNTIQKYNYRSGQGSTGPTARIYNKWG